MNKITVEEILKQDKKSFVHDYKGQDDCQSRCQVDLYKVQDRSVVVFTDLGIGTSVSNWSEKLATQMISLLKLDPQQTLWLECTKLRAGLETFEQINYTWEGTEYKRPVWEKISREDELRLPTSMQKPPGAGMKPKLN